MQLVCFPPLPTSFPALAGGLQRKSPVARVALAVRKINVAVSVIQFYAVMLLARGGVSEGERPAPSVQSSSIHAMKGEIPITYEKPHLSPLPWALSIVDPMINPQRCRLAGPAGGLSLSPSTTAAARVCQVFPNGILKSGSSPLPSVLRRHDPPCASHASSINLGGGMSRPHSRRAGQRYREKMDEDCGENDERRRSSCLSLRFSAYRWLR